MYNHFAGLDELLPACTAHYREAHPLPDLQAAFTLAEPVERLRAVLTALYGWYRETAPLQRRVNGERATVPELDAWMARSSDPVLGEMAAGLSHGFDHPGAHALVGVALEFWTWQRLDHEGLDDAAAAGLMAAAVSGGGGAGSLSGGDAGTA